MSSKLLKAALDINFDGRRISEIPENSGIVSIKIESIQTTNLTSCGTSYLVIGQYALFESQEDLMLAVLLGQVTPK